MTQAAVRNEVLPAKYEAVVGVLREGKENATLSTDIVSLAGLNDKRQVHEIIERLVVRHGYCIGSSRQGEYKGYYFISNDIELQQTLHTYNEQIQSMMNRHRALQENYRNRNGND